MPFKLVVNPCCTTKSLPKRNTSAASKAEGRRVSLNFKSRKSISSSCCSVKRAQKRESSLLESTVEPCCSKRLKQSTSDASDGKEGCVKSKLNSIIIEYLKHQHSECQAPISVLPPFSLMEPHVCPKAKLEGTFVENTIPNVTCRVMKMQSRAHPGEFKHLDRKLNKHFVHSRFRHMRTCKDDTSFTACSFMGNSQQLVVSTDSGDLRILDTFSGEVVDYFDSHAHSSAIHSLHTWP